VNADEAAIALAAALPARELLLVSDVPGVLVNGAVLPRLAAEAAESLMDEGAVTGGMIVKLRQALVAANAGVNVRIGGGEILEDPRAGTLIVPTQSREAAAEVAT
jgi:acetylglutamate kinase